LNGCQFPGADSVAADDETTFSYLCECECECVTTCTIDADEVLESSARLSEFEFEFDAENRGGGSVGRTESSDLSLCGAGPAHCMAFLCLSLFSVLALARL